MSKLAPCPINPHQVMQWHGAFLQLNQARLDAARKLMGPRQQVVLDVLPVLLHINHPRLPGFIDYAVPSGVRHFSPSEQQVASAQTIARSIQLPRGNQTVGRITGLYLMGSMGSLAQARTSDLDIWVCLDESLSPEEIAALQQKCSLLERWAQSQACEVHFFLMNLAEFRLGQMQSSQGEDCGTTQHLLLLDEFYRSAIWLAGGQPRWWLIPSEWEAKSDELWQSMVDHYHVRDEQWLNFGAIADIPPAEFVGAGLWQLHKGLSDPYKSLLKLLLTRHYASQYPKSRPLCWDLKNQVHQGMADAQSNDAYLLLLKRISEQVQQDGNLERVQLIRRAFYYKAQLPMSGLSLNQRNSWRNSAMAALCTQWGWDHSTYQELDERPHWSPLRIAQERNALISEMLSSYRFLTGFSQQYVPKLHISHQDMRSLGNRLYAAFDNRPGKIVNINPGISPSLAQDILTLNLVGGVWQLIPGLWQPSSGLAAEVLKQSPSFVELLCFARLNGLLQSHTRIMLYPTHNPMSAFEQKEVLQVIRELEPPSASQIDFLQAARPLQWHLFVNVGVDPQHHLSRRGMQKLSSRDDALGFSATRDNLVMTLDLLSLNSWGEWHVERFSGDQALLHCMQHQLQHLTFAREHGWPVLQVHCHCASRASAIRHRVEQVMQDVLPHFLNKPRSPYVLEVAEAYYSFENTRQGIQLRVADSPAKLLALLQRQFSHYVHYTLDRSALINSPIRLILEQSRAGVWQIFYWLRDDRLYFYFLDEKGALLHQQWASRALDNNLTPWLLPMLRFLRQVDLRWQRLSERNQPRKVALFELFRKTNSYEFDMVRRRLPELAAQSSSIDLRVVVIEQQATLYCNGEEFSAWQHGDGLYSAVIQKVLSMRQSHHDYPLWLNDVELKDDHRIIEHLQTKLRLENRLLQARQQRMA